MLFFVKFGVLMWACVCVAAAFIFNVISKEQHSHAATMPSTDMKICCVFFLLAPHIRFADLPCTHLVFFFVVVHFLRFSSVSSSSLCELLCVRRRRYTKIPQCQSQLDSISYSQRIKMIRFKYIVTQTGHSAMREWGENRRCYELNDFESTRQIRDTSNQLFTFEWIVDADLVAAAAAVVAVVVYIVRCMNYIQVWTAERKWKTKHFDRCSEVWPNLFKKKKTLFSTHFLLCVCVLNDGRNRDSPSSLLSNPFSLIST